MNSSIDGEFGFGQNARQLNVRRACAPPAPPLGTHAILHCLRGSGSYGRSHSPGAEDARH